MEQNVQIIGGGNAYTANGFLHTLTDLITKYEAEFESLATNKNGNVLMDISVLAFSIKIVYDTHRVWTTHNLTKKE